jgi:glycosyltransferase involved in cell wall biosynthesis
MARQGASVDVITSDAGLEKRPEIPRSARVPVNGVNVTYYPRASGFGIRSPGMEQAIRARVGRADIVHVTGIWQRTSPAAYRAAVRAGVPLVISPRGALNRYCWSQRSLRKLVYYAVAERYGLRNASGFHYTSPLEAAECRRYRFSARECLVPNAIDTSFWRNDPKAGAAWRTEHGFTGSQAIALYAGRLAPKKNLQFLIPILASCSAWHLVLIGFDERGQAEQLRRKATENGCADRLHILPGAGSEELRSAYSAANLFVLPSLDENFANCVAEAVACGCPAVVSDKVGCADALAEGGWVQSIPLVSEAWIAALTERNAGQHEMNRPDLDSLSADACAKAMLDFYGAICADKQLGDQK